MSLGKHPRLKSSGCAFAPHQENRSVSSQFKHKLLSKRLQNNLDLLFFVIPFLDPECGLITLIFWFRFCWQSKFSLFVFLCLEVRVGCILQCLWLFVGSLADLELFLLVVGFVVDSPLVRLISLGLCWSCWDGVLFGFTLVFIVTLILNRLGKASLQLEGPLGEVWFDLAGCWPVEHLLVKVAWFCSSLVGWFSWRWGSSGAILGGKGPWSGLKPST